jgi:hypothetical protein
LKKKIISDLSDEAFQSIGGSTDSEHLFAMFLDRYESLKEEHGALAVVKALEVEIKF